MVTEKYEGFENFLNKREYAELSTDEQEFRKGVLHFFKGEYEAALEQFEKPSTEGRLNPKDMNSQVHRVQRIMKGLCLMKLDKLFDAAFWFNGYVETTVEESQPKYALFRDLCLAMAGKSYKYIYDTWGEYSKERWTSIPLGENTYTTEDKNINAEWPIWPTKNKL